jgi:glutamine synthetase
MADRSLPTLQSLRDKGVSRVELGLTDIDGVIRGKYVSLDKFGSLLGEGGGFCDCVFGWDVADQLYDNARYTGWHTGYPDAHFKLIADTMRWVPDASTPFWVSSLRQAAGNTRCARVPACAECSRRRRRKV